MVKRPILYITHTIKHKVRGTLEKRRRNALAFIRLFLMTLYRLTYTNAKGEKVVKFGDILELVTRYSQFTLLAIAIFPLVLPIPYPPGMPSILIIPVLIFTINGLFGRKFIKMPSKVVKYEMKFDSIKKMVTQSRFIITILARISKGGRLKVLADDNMQRMHLCFILLMSVIILLPFPGANYFPSISIFITAIGCVLTDGILVVAGYFIGIAGILLFALVILFGKKIILTLVQFIKYMLH